jgi:hypothetical protein
MRVVRLTIGNLGSSPESNLRGLPLPGSSISFLNPLPFERHSGKGDLLYAALKISLILSKEGQIYT